VRKEKKGEPLPAPKPSRARNILLMAGSLTLQCAVHTWEQSRCHTASGGRREKEGGGGGKGEKKEKTILYLPVINSLIVICGHRSSVPRRWRPIPRQKRKGGEGGREKRGIHR